jgi:lysophospholipase L1-like esterase
MNYKKKILFLGASITQGKISKNYVKMLKDKFGTKQYKFINYGIAGYESYNVLNKLDKAIKIMPDYLIVLVGTNDVLSSLNPKLAKLSRKLKHIPHEPTLNHYSSNITSMIKSLKQGTHSKIALVSLPIIGENLESIENRTISEYNTELKKIAENENIFYLPVYEKQKAFLKRKIGGMGKDCINSTKMAFKSLILHYILFKSLDTISVKNGFFLLTDGIHLNSIGAKFVSDEIENFIKVNENK